MSIEILENTLLKLLVRRGTDTERKEVTLDEGEFGYTTDTKRVFIGDGTTPGGTLVGNKFLGTAETITSKTGAVGDIAFDSDNNILQFISENNGGSINDWVTISNLASAGDSTINIDTSQRITIGKLSAGNIDLNALGSSIELDGSEKVALSSFINIDGISQRTVDAGSYLELPHKLKINAIDYDFPSVKPSVNNSQLISDPTGQLRWALPTVVETIVPNTSAGAVPVGSIVPFISAVANVPYGWLKCDGSTVTGTNYPDLSGVIGNRYGGTGDNFVLPDFTRATLYGSAVADPFVGTEYNVVSGLGQGNASVSGSLSSSPLSAIATTFIIKAIDDKVSAPTISFNTPLSAAKNGIRIDNTATQFLSGTIEVGLSSNNDGYPADSKATIYRNIYLDSPVELINDGTDFVVNSWTGFDLPTIVPVAAKVIHCQYTIPNRAAFYFTFDNSALPAATSKKFVLGDAGGGTVQGRSQQGDGGQFTARFNRTSRKLFVALDGNRTAPGLQPNVFVDIIGYGE
jgi:microcystin-dependent protein